MKAQEGVVDHLNIILSAELLAINQSFVHAKLCEHWGFARLHHTIRARSIEAMKAADRLIGHMLYFEGVPTVHRMSNLPVGQTVPEQFTFDLKAEQDLLALLRKGVCHCAQVGDFTTRYLLEHRTAQVDTHIEWIEVQRASIAEAGLEHYLAEQLTSDSSSQ